MNWHQVKRTGSQVPMPTHGQDQKRCHKAASVATTEEVFVSIMAQNSEKAVALHYKVLQSPA
jgi:hypothetical protein